MKLLYTLQKVLLTLGTIRNYLRALSYLYLGTLGGGWFFDVSWFLVFVVFDVALAATNMSKLMYNDIAY